MMVCWSSFGKVVHLDSNLPMYALDKALGADFATVLLNLMACLCNDLVNIVSGGWVLLTLMGYYKVTIF